MYTYLILLRASIFVCSRGGAGGAERLITRPTPLRREYIDIIIILLALKFTAWGLLVNLDIKSLRNLW